MPYLFEKPQRKLRLFFVYTIKPTAKKVEVVQRITLCSNKVNNLIVVVIFFHNICSTNEGVSYSNQFVWFRKWIMERQVYQYLVRDSAMSQSSIQRLFQFYLKSPPENLRKAKEMYIFLLMLLIF